MSTASVAAQKVAPLEESIEVLMHRLGKNAKSAGQVLSVASSDAKNKALRTCANQLRSATVAIIDANQKDLAWSKGKGLTKAMLDRLMLNDERIEAMAKGLEDIAELADPVGQVMDAWERPNGLKISRVRVPLGVIGVIYESRPNVTADAGGLCLKSGNAVILRGGSESLHSSMAIADCLHAGLKDANLPEDCIQLVPTRDRAAVGEMLRMTDFIDVIVPRGGKSLIERIDSESKIPLFRHLEGVCHTYVHADADIETARKVLLNAKMRRTGICGATETLLIDQNIAEKFLPSTVDDLVKAECEIRGDAAAQKIDARIKPATEDDWYAEYLDAIISVRIIGGLDEAIDHITRYGSEHTDSIITENANAAEEFLNRVGSAIVMVNASTQFADGGEFGMGAEIGISTGKMHARGPVGVEQLTTYKYKVVGTGQCRP
ncbi:MAG: glutamate-5-semialdehyde dehydrogenase [Rhodospirillaceae bacterium]|jgi:glutamate-5-semialdehyde dehydrogenase